MTNSTSKRANSLSFFLYSDPSLLSMTVVLYAFPLSAPCRAVLLLAQLIGVALDVKPIDLMKGEQLADDFIKVRDQFQDKTIQYSPCPRRPDQSAAHGAHNGGLRRRRRRAGAVGEPCNHDLPDRQLCGQRFALSGGCAPACHHRPAAAVRFGHAVPASVGLLR